MARWRLTALHYINVPDIEWEYRETNRDTGRMNRKVFKVPLHLDPAQPADQNYDGEVIVAQAPGNMPRDYIFFGDPTPDMEPLDEAAQAITDQCKAAWIHPIESLPGQGFSDNLIAAFEKQMTELMRNNKASPVSAKGIDPKEFEQMKEQLAQLIARNAELENKEPKIAAARRA